MRDSEKNFSWLGDGGVLDQRTLYVQNWPSLWRADVVAVLDSIGQPIEEVRSTAYGTPSVHPMADVNHDGLVNATDVSVWAQIQGGNAPTGVWSNDDLNRDELFPGDVADDDFFFDRHASSAGGSYGFHRLSSIGNRVGYAGYVWDATSRVWHVRHRVLESESGKWTRMDPLMYVDGAGVYEYTQSTPLNLIDPLGLTSISAATFVVFVSPAIAPITASEIAMPVRLPVRPSPVTPGPLWPEVPLRPSPVTPGPLWPSSPGHLPRTPGILLPVNQCILVGVVFYCIGTELSPHVVPALDPWIGPEVEPTSTPPMFPIPDSPDSSDECVELLRQKHPICDQPRLPLGDQGAAGSSQRARFCSALRFNKRLEEACRNHLWKINQVCRGGKWENDDSGYDHEGEFRQRGLNIERFQRLINRLCLVEQ
jgi:RHS repeat-associated protein